MFAEDWWERGAVVQHKKIDLFSRFMILLIGEFPELFIVELIHYAWHAHKRQLLNSLAAEVDAFIDFGLFLVGPLAENKINLMAARELVADAEAHTGEIGG